MIKLDLIPEKLIDLVDLIDRTEDEATLESLRGQIAQRLGINSTLDAIFCAVLISGIQPGTGSSTTKELLTKVLGTPLFHDTGSYRRVIAKCWENFAKEKGGRNQENWSLFEAQFLDERIGTTRVMMVETNPNNISDRILRSFNQDQLKFSLRDVMWDKLSDELVFDQILEMREGVWQGKLTAVIDTLLGKNFQTLALPVLRVLFTIDPNVAASRVAQREGLKPEQAFTDIGERVLRDWKIFSEIYGIDKTIFDRGDIQKIDTTYLPPAEVVATILALMQQHWK